MEAAEWDRRYAEARQWSVEPNRTAAELTAGLPPGRALDVAAGEEAHGAVAGRRGMGGRRDRPLGRRSPAGAGERAAGGTGHVAGRGRADRGSGFGRVRPGPRAVPAPSACPAGRVLARSAAAVRPGGHLLVLGHDRENLTRGIGGPQDPDVLYGPELLAGAVPSWGNSRLERIDRDTDSGIAVDTLLFAQRP